MYFSKVPLKRKSLENSLTCLFCNDLNNIVQNPKAESYLTVQKATFRRRDDVKSKFDSMYDSNAIKQTFSWHRTCFSNYVSEEKIRRREIELQKTINETVTSPTTPTSTEFCERSQMKLRSLRDDINNKVESKCIICNQFKKDGVTSTYVISNRDCAEKLMISARSKMDHIFTKISIYDNVESILAQELRYHDICLKNYIYIPKESPKKKGRISLKPSLEDVQKAFTKVLKEIDFNNQMFELDFLTKRVNNFIEVDEMNENRYIDNRLMKEFLIKEYGEKILFSESYCKNKSPIVFVTDVPLSQLVERVRQADDINNKIKDVTDVLKREILETGLKAIDTYVCDEVVIEKYLNTFELPRTWSFFLQSLLCNKRILDKQKLIRAKSIFMDICFTMQGLHSPKHIALAQTIHHLFRSKHLINILSKLGHCISYYELTECNNFIMKKQLADQNCSRIRCPSNIIQNKPDLFLHGAIDNNDFLEETLSGKNTTHVTSMVLYQESRTNLWSDISIATKESVKNITTDSLSFSSLDHFVITNNQPKFENAYKEINQLKIETNHYIEMIWILSKLKVNNDSEKNYIVSRDKELVVPNWSPFNEIISTDNQPVSTVAHCPVIPYPPTSYNVVYTAIKNFVALCESCGKIYSVLTADMAIYLMCKVIQMQASNPFPKLIMRIGSFHLQKIWTTILGQYLDGCGIEDILISDLDLYSENTFKSILNGLQYNRGVRLHKLIYESIKTIQIFEYAKSSEKSVLLRFLSIPQYNSLRESIVDGDSMKVRAIIQNLNDCNEAEEFCKSFHNFISLKCKDNKVFLYFNRYCEMVEILLDSIRADRTGNFDLHLSATVKMLPYLFAFNHPLYVRGTLLYLQDMLNLPEIVKMDLERGMASVKRKDGRFNGVGGDLALEQTQNRSSAISGGWVGISTNEISLQKWLLLYPTKSSIHQSLLSFCKMNDDPFDLDNSSVNHKEWSSSRMNKDDQDVLNIIDMLISKNIFSNDSNNASEQLHNISNGKCATDEIASYLLTVKEYGEALLHNFTDERLIKKEKSIFDRIPRVIVKNFNYVDKSKKKKDDKDLKNAKELLSIQQTIMLLFQRGFTIESFAHFELLDYPKSLADSEGFFKKSVKSSLMDEIEKRTNCSVDSLLIAQYPTQKIHIFDGMVIVHLLQLGKFSTFGHFASQFYKYVTSFYKDPNVTRLHVIFDRYDDLSIKYSEYLLRTKNVEVSEIKIQNADTKIPPNIKIFLANMKNKLELVKFLCQQAYNYVSLDNHQQLFISGGFPDIEKCYKLVGGTMFEVPELKSNHLEADTRIFSHAIYDFQIASQIIIHSVDTDIFILGIHYWPYFKSQGSDGLFFKINSQKPRTLGCNIAAENLSDSLCKILPALHAFTGCDTTSKIGTKKKALDLVCADEKYVSALSTLGTQHFNYEQFQILERLYLQLLGKNGETADDARRLIFNRSCGIGINMANIPCTSDALYQHTLRAFAQTYIWISALYAYYTPIDFTQWGYYKSEDNVILPKFMTKNALPENIIKPCNCKKTCKTKACHCKKNSLNCIALCGCDLDICENKYMNIVSDDDND